ncbi:E3 ubiquitin-protein ligase DTX4-like isoform X1 [Tachypleus tridentatus]|uniref:E3 ubiquitin-protein ligase DTX4-like isoform X1 n=1 Tax=Tachypleus tridentatus TaxID=6853 RepID=UPI003FCF59A6
MAVALALQAVVWEWMGADSRWKSYPPEVAQLLERAYGKGLNMVRLGDAEASLTYYSVNLKEFLQISDITGSSCPVRRKIYPEGSPAARGILWQWSGDQHGVWENYDIGVANYIEGAFQQGRKSIDLSQILKGYSYTINFKPMNQINNLTGYMRSVRRIRTTAFPLVRNAVNTSSIRSTYTGGQVLISAANQEDKYSNKTKGSVTKEKKTHGILSHVTNLAAKAAKTVKESNPSSSPATISQNMKLVPAKSSKNWNVFLHTFYHLLRNNVPAPKGSQNSSSLGNGIVPAQAPCRPIFWPPYTPDAQLKPVPGIKPPKTVRKKSKKHQTSINEVIDQFSKELTIRDVLEDCIICCDTLTEGSPYDNDPRLVALLHCDHIFHRSCLKEMYNSGLKDGHLQCPTCKTIYGEKTGIQPPGSMDFHLIPYSLPGFPGYSTIHIIYNISAGIQGPEHPNPNKPYTARGFPRHCYLPNTDKGRKVLRLLVKAWERRLIFTVGVSSTTGEPNTVTWNEIHHKTEFGSNITGHGYPDLQYLDNVLTELKLQGILE